MDKPQRFKVSGPDNIAHVGDIISFPQMLDNPDWKPVGKQKFEILSIYPNGEMDLKMVTPVKS